MACGIRIIVAACRVRTRHIDAGRGKHRAVDNDCADLDDRQHDHDDHCRADDNDSATDDTTSNYYGGHDNATTDNDCADDETAHDRGCVGVSERFLHQRRRQPSLQPVSKPIGASGSDRAMSRWHLQLQPEPQRLLLTPRRCRTVAVTPSRAVRRADRAHDAAGVRQSNSESIASTAPLAVGSTLWR